MITAGFPDGVSAAAVNGCWQCHGSEVKVLPTQLDPATWPNSGIGRLNPDGSEGSCNACHTRHSFLGRAGASPRHLRQVPHGTRSPAEGDLRGVQARHRFFANIDKMNMDSAKWIVGEDYSAGSDLRDLPHVGDQESVGHARRRHADQLEQPSGDVHSSRGFGREDGAARQGRSLASAPSEHEGRLQQLPQQGLDRQLLHPVRRRSSSCTTEVRRARRGALRARQAADEAGEVRQQDRLHLVRALAPRGSARAPRRR